MTVMSSGSRLSAVDADAGENGTVSFRFVAGNDVGVLSLDEHTGALRFGEWSDEQLLAGQNPAYRCSIAV